MTPDQERRAQAAADWHRLSHDALTGMATAAVVDGRTNPGMVFMGALQALSNLVGLVSGDSADGPVFLRAVADWRAAEAEDVDADGPLQTLDALVEKIRHHVNTTETVFDSVTPSPCKNVPEGVRIIGRVAEFLLPEGERYAFVHGQSDDAGKIVAASVQCLHNADHLGQAYQLLAVSAAGYADAVNRLSENTEGSA
jgi:hypothetical protein